MGAILTEARILRWFYIGRGACYRRGDRLNCAEEVEEARLLFEETRNSAERVRSRALDPPPHALPE
jgi:hypothetical protein